MMRHKPQPRVYVIETNGKALVAFEAVSGREANELVKEGWFRDELLYPILSNYGMAVRC